MKFYDAHIYYDDLRTDFNQLENLNKKYQCEFIISPQCTIQSEPEKSNLMYFLQPYLLSNTNVFGLLDPSGVLRAEISCKIQLVSCQTKLWSLKYWKNVLAFFPCLPILTPNPTYPQPPPSIK